jgi:hypothetical protein
MDVLGRALLFVLVVVVLPAALLCGVHWLAAAFAPGFSAACAAMAPYALWIAAYAALAYVALALYDMEA